MKLEDEFVVTAANLKIDPTSCAYENSFEKVCTISTAEEMKWFMARLKQFDLVIEENKTEKYCLNVFRNGVEPQWEDKSNINGCSYILSVKNDRKSTYIFENLLFYFLTNKFRNVKVNGIRVDARKTFNKLGIWLEEVPDMQDGHAVFKELSHSMGFTYNVSFLFRNHQKLVEKLTTE